MSSHVLALVVVETTSHMRYDEAHKFRPGAAYLLNIAAATCEWQLVNEGMRKGTPQYNVCNYHEKEHNNYEALKNSLN